MEHVKPAVGLRGLVKRFDDVEAVAGVDLDIAPGEFFSMLGPSGSGKTTVLRIIAGFEQPTEGTVSLAGTNVTRLAPFERDVTTVFQDYALFPHMSVIDNVAYGLRVRGVRRGERRRRAEEALETVRLRGMSTRRPTQLSGGQRQRVALARALVVRPSVLLLDEPLGALDLKLREQMQVELHQIQRDVGVTFVFVTHDQEEALSMSDRVAVFDSGRIVQVAPPRELYDRPATEFVAGFVGTANLLSGENARRLVGTSDLHTVRPERIQVHSQDRPAGGDRGDTVEVDGTLAEVIFAGPVTRYLVDTDEGLRLVATVPHADPDASDLRRGDRVTLSWSRVAAVPVRGRDQRPEDSGPDRAHPPPQPPDQTDNQDPSQPQPQETS